MAGVIEGNGAGVGVMGLGVGSTRGRGMVLKPYCPRSDGRYTVGSGEGMVKCSQVWGWGRTVVDLVMHPGSCSKLSSDWSKYLSP